MTTDTLRDAVDVLTLHDGKYTLVLHENGQARVLRYGEPWRNISQELVGDHFMASLIEYAMESQAAHDADKARIAVLEELLKECMNYMVSSTLEHCDGNKCREPWCIGCSGEEHAEETITSANAAYQAACAALTTQASEVE